MTRIFVYLYLPPSVSPLKNRKESNEFPIKVLIAPICLLRTSDVINLIKKEEEEKKEKLKKRREQTIWKNFRKDASKITQTGYSVNYFHLVSRNRSLISSDMFLY